MIESYCILTSGERVTRKGETGKEAKGHFFRQTHFKEKYLWKLSIMQKIP